MSVAFRRESDEEHKEPRFEIPIPAGPNLVTARGVAQIADVIAGLELRLETAGGDDLEPIRRDLRYWNTRRTTAEQTAAPIDGTVGFGSRVTYKLDSRERTLEFVGDDEADPARNRVAFSAPLARAMMGADIGETVAFGGRDDAITIVAIEAI